MALSGELPRPGTARIGGKQYASLACPMREVGALLDAKAVHGGRSAYNHLLCLAQTKPAQAAGGRGPRARRPDRGGGSKAATVRTNAPASALNPWRYAWNGGENCDHSAYC